MKELTPARQVRKGKQKKHNIIIHPPSLLPSLSPIDPECIAQMPVQHKDNILYFSRAFYCVHSYPAKSVVLK
jgi:hypothetical protein